MEFIEDHWTLGGVRHPDLAFYCHTVDIRGESDDSIANPKATFTVHERLLCISHKWIQLYRRCGIILGWPNKLTDTGWLLLTFLLSSRARFICEPEWCAIYFTLCSGDFHDRPHWSHRHQDRTLCTLSLHNMRSCQLT